MRISSSRLACTGLAALLLAGCGNDAGGGGNTPPPGSVPVPTATLGAAPANVAIGESSLLSWSSTNATGCTASNGWTGAKAASGSETIPDIQATTIYTLTCTGAGGTSSAVSATVTATAVAPASAETANAGPSRTVISGAAVRLSGEASVDPQGDALQYAWTQTGGTNVTLNGASTASPTFTAPSVTSNTDLTFSLTVSDGAAAPSPPSTVTITVAPLVANNVLVEGRITFVRIPFSASLNVGLNYAAPVSRPARGIVMVANSAGTTTQLATGETDADGNFALSVPQNTPIDLRAVARMTRDAGVPLPRWNFSVVDADVNTTPYFFTDGAFNSSTGVTHDMSIPSGFNSAGTVTGTRASAPFAVLDTVYTAVQTIVGVAPTTNFPALLLDWATNNEGGQTFFDSGGAGAQMIVLSADPAEDTDEFDQHVIAHEFGHYIEHNFSRADNIGGSHGLGDKLDIRVAFGEGFGYAFAAIALKDPIARDSFVIDNNGTPQLVSSTFNVETNPSQNPPGTPSGNFGCWCSESSVWSLLWDMYDGATDANDTVALGFKPMWDVLIDEQRTTPVMTSIFTFTTALKDTLPSQAGAIDTLFAAQNISTVADALGTSETHYPTPVASAAALPVYTSLASGSPVTVRSVDDAGHYNTLGNHRFVRYVKSGSGGQVVTVTSNGTDPDVVAYRNGAFVLAARAAGNESFTITTAGTYVFDVYECSNGCDDDEGTPGDYDVTVTVN
jgi:hypothetical protein